jgi:two-component system NarL family sensor kinase
MKTFAFFLLLLSGMAAGLPVARSQDAARDSLLRLAAAAPTDSARVQLTMEAGKLYLGPQPDSALAWFERARRLAEQSGYRRGVARCQINAAYALLDLGQHDRALELCTQAVAICGQLKMGKELVAAYNSMGNVYNYRGDPPKAIEHYLLALKTMEWAQGLPPHFPIGVRNNLAMLYVSLREFDKGLDQAQRTYREALDLGDEHSAALAAQHIATALMGMNREAEAIPYFETALDLARKTEQPKVCVSMLTYLGSINTDHGRFDESRQQYGEAIDLARGLGDTYSLMTCEYGLGELALRQQRYDEAKSHTLTALHHAEAVNVQDFKQSIFLQLSDIALAQGDFARWSHYREAYQDLRDTLASNAVFYATTELETRYETEKKQQQIDRLEREQEIQQLRLQRNNVFMLSLAGLAALLGLLGFTAYRAARQRRRLAEQEVLIQHQKIRELENEKQLAAVDAVLRGQEEERGRLARDLHDGLGGLLSGIRQSVHALFRTAHDPAVALQEQADGSALAANREAGNVANLEVRATDLLWVEERLDHSIHELRQVSRHLMPEALLRFGLADAVRDYCDHLEHGQSLRIHYQAYGLERRPEQHVEVVLFRIIQELLNNIVKHAGATEAIVQLIRDENRLHLTVEDNGRGFDYKNTPPTGIGWINIRSRVDYLGGRLEVQSAPGHGTSVSVEVSA